MRRGDYYEAMKALAAEKRLKYEVSTSKLGLRELRAIYKNEGIAIDMWELSPRIRAAYMCDDGDPSVVVSKTLPAEPRLFAMVHELKHHYCDRETIARGRLNCGDYNANQMIEIGAEVFAAEFIYPEQEFLACIAQLGIEAGSCTPEQVVELKRRCGAQVSYTFLRKRLEWFEIVPSGEFAKVQFQKLEESIYGLPIYKQAWFKKYRARKQNV